MAMPDCTPVLSTPEANGSLQFQAPSRWCFVLQPQETHTGDSTKSALISRVATLCYVNCLVFNKSLQDAQRNEQMWPNTGENNQKQASRASQASS